MWYFAWILGVGFAVLLAIMNAMWGEMEESGEPSARRQSSCPAGPTGSRAGRPALTR